MRTLKKKRFFVQRRHFDVTLTLFWRHFGHYDVILTFFLKCPQNRQKTCYRCHWPLVGKLFSCTLRKCKNAPLMCPSFFLLTVQIWPKSKKWRHVVKWRHDVRTSPKWKHIIIFMITNFCANINPFGWFLRKLWQKTFLKDFYRISWNLHT